MDRPITRDDIITRLADEGKMLRPELIARIDRALDIIAHGGIIRQADGTYLVPSSSRVGRTYTVNGHCDCADARGIASTAAPGGWCKHRLAVGLIKRADLIIRAHRQEQAELDAIAAAAEEAYEEARQELAQAMREFNAARKAAREAIAAATAGAPVPPAFCRGCNGVMVPVAAADAPALRARTIPRLAAAIGRPATTSAAAARKAA